MVKILKKPGRQRKANENDLVISLIKGITFFKVSILFLELFRLVTFLRNNYIDISQAIQLLELPATATVFEYDSYGDLFYIILEGEVSVHVPDKASGEQYRK